MNAPRNHVCVCGHVSADHQRQTSPLAVPTIKARRCLKDDCSCTAFFSEWRDANQKAA